jgi:spoIIIJ-associated protein
MNIKINSEVRIKENIITILLVSENNNILIGKDGKTLNSIQLLLRQALGEINKFGLKVLVDASNYKEKKAKYLEYEIKKICNEILKTKMEVKLDPMNSFERRIVHSLVGEYDHLESLSIGEAPNRYTVIQYKD